MTDLIFPVNSVQEHLPTSGKVELEELALVNVFDCIQHGHMPMNWRRIPHLKFSGPIWEMSSCC